MLLLLQVQILRLKSFLRGRVFAPATVFPATLTVCPGSQWVGDVNLMSPFAPIEILELFLPWLKLAAHSEKKQQQLNNLESVFFVVVEAFNLMTFRGDCKQI